jgi:hypothetical protein
MNRAKGLVFEACNWLILGPGCRLWRAEAPSNLMPGYQVFSSDICIALFDRERTEGVTGKRIISKLEAAREQIRTAILVV